jgi:hypothetical protein
VGDRVAVVVTARKSNGAPFGLLAHPASFRTNEFQLSLHGGSPNGPPAWADRSGSRRARMSQARPCLIQIKADVPEFAIFVQ